MAVFFKVQGRSLQVAKDTLQKNPYFFNLLKHEIYSEVQFTAPEWMTFRHLELYFSCLSSSNLPKLDVLTLHKLLWISDYFQDSGLQGKIISEILPDVHKDTVLFLLQDAYVKLQSKNYIGAWEELYGVCKEVAGKNLKHILMQFSNVFEKLDLGLAEEVIEEWLKNRYFTTADHSLIVDRLREASQTGSLPGLIRYKEKKVQEKLPEKVFQVEIGGNAAEVFEVGGMAWELTCVAQKNSFQVSISPKVNAKDSNIIIAVYIQCLLAEENPENFPAKLILLPVVSPSQCILREFFRKPNRVNVYARVEFVYSAIIQNLMMYPECLLNDSIAELSFECLEFLVTLHNFNVKSEDHVLEIIGKWCEETTEKPNENDVKILLHSVRWDFVTLKCLISSVSKYPFLKKYAAFREVFTDQFFKKGQNISRGQRPRKGYKTSEKEVFSKSKDLIESIAEILLDLDFPQELLENGEITQEMNKSVNLQESEILKLKGKYSSLRSSQEITYSPTPIIQKFTESAEGFNRIPNRLRNSSLGASLCRSLRKPKKMNLTGQLLSALVKKISKK